MNKEIALVPTSEELNVYQVMAKTAAQSQMFAKIGGETGLLSIMLMARELGLPAFQSVMGGMSVIQGKVELSPRLMNSMIRKSGHKLEIIESTEQICKIKGIRHDTKEEYIASFSIDDARRAGLVRSGGGWEKYASDMLFARCISRLARRLFADVISTAYVEGEVEREEAAQKTLESTITSQTDPVSVHVDISQPEAKEMSLDDFLKKIDKYDFQPNLSSLEQYLYELSTKKNGKPIPLQKVMEQAIKLPDRFVKSYNDWQVEMTKKIENFSEQEIG